MSLPTGAVTYCGKGLFFLWVETQPALVGFVGEEQCSWPSVHVDNPTLTNDHIIMNQDVWYEDLRIHHVDSGFKLKCS